MADMAGQDADEFDVARFSAFRELCGKLARPTGPGEGVGLYVANDLVEIKESADGSTVDVTMYADDTAEIWIDDGKETYRIAMVINNDQFIVERHNGTPVPTKMRSTYLKCGDRRYTPKEFLETVKNFIEAARKLMWRFTYRWYSPN